MKNPLIIYQTEDGKIKIQTHFENQTVWLNIEQIAELFQKSRSTINEHIINIYQQQELKKMPTMRKIGNSDFSTKPTNFYNLDVVISVGYKVKSQQGVHFRKWATALIKEYLLPKAIKMLQLLRQLIKLLIMPSAAFVKHKFILL